MKAAVFYAPNQRLEIEDLSLEGPRDREVLVRIAAVGVCHSDYHLLDGSMNGPAYPAPMVLGHEAAGVVEAVGAGVTDVTPGDHVIVSVTPFCGRCRLCLGGQPFLCEAMVTAPGTNWDGSRRLRKGQAGVNHFARVSAFAEYAVVHESQSVPIRRDMPLDRAALIGCGVMTGTGAVLNTASVEAGASIAIFGTGGVGLSAVQGGVLAGATTIIAVDLLDNKLAWAHEFGATHAINASRDDPVQRIRELTGGYGVDYAFDAIGRPQVTRQAFDAVRRGGMAVVVGVLPTGSEIALPGAMTAKTLKACVMGSQRPQIDFPRLVSYYMQGRLKLDEMISQRYALSEINEAFDALARGENARGVLIVDPPSVQDRVEVSGQSGR
jgi:S-(hydroxymethyl)glutathione dehydrogenase/alcohol dehydrogenase